MVDALQLVLKYLKDIGIDAKANQQEYGAYIASTFYGKYESMAFGPQTPFLDPDNFLFGPHMPGELKNQSHVNDPVLADMLIRQRRTADVAKRREVLHDIQRHLAKQQYYVYAAVRRLHRRLGRRAQELLAEPGLRLGRQGDRGLARPLRKDEARGRAPRALNPA